MSCGVTTSILKDVIAALCGDVDAAVGHNQHMCNEIGELEDTLQSRVLAAEGVMGEVIMDKLRCPNPNPKPNHGQVKLGSRGCNHSHQLSLGP